jgi:hypothetical protein
MSNDAIGVIILVVAIVLAGAVSTWFFRWAAAKRAGSGVLQVIVWAHSGRLPGLSREKKWKAKGERGRAWPPGVGQAGG